MASDAGGAQPPSVLAVDMSEQSQQQAGGEEPAAPQATVYGWRPAALSQPANHVSVPMSYVGGGGVAAPAGRLVSQPLLYVPAGGLPPDSPYFKSAGAQPDGRSRCNTSLRVEQAMSQRWVALSRHKLKAVSRTSALLAGFAMVALVENDYETSTPRWLLLCFAGVTTALVSVHLLALMMSTCMLPHMEAAGEPGAAADSPHHLLKNYIELSWFFSTCVGLFLFLVEIAVILWVKFSVLGFFAPAYLGTAMLVPVMVVFVLFAYKFYRGLDKHMDDERKAALWALREQEKQLEMAAAGQWSSPADQVHVPLAPVQVGYCAQTAGVQHSPIHDP